MASYFCIPQSPVLRNSVCSFWQTQRETNFQMETILPKGGVEVIFNFYDQDRIQARFGERHYQLPLCFINGFNTKPIRLQLPREQFFFGVRFQPSAIRDIFGIPAGEFANHSEDLTLIDRSIHSLWHQLIEQDSFEKKVSLLSGWLLRRDLATTNRDQLLNHFLQDNYPGTPSVRELSGIVCYSPRQLSRKLQQLTGMNTEEILLYKRYLQSLHLIQHSSLSLTEIAYECKFSDQSHFIKTFKSLALMTPGDYRKGKGHIPGHIYEDVR